MGRLKALFVIIFTTVNLAACAQLPSQPSHPLVAAYSESWNERDVQKMSALMHPEIQWLSVEGTSIVIEVEGKPQLVAAMQEWFVGANLPLGSLRDWSINGNYVAVTETASWTDDSGTAQSQSALTVYELQDNLIRRVYYYPSVKK